MKVNLKDYASRLRITDGAWGTELERRGLPPGVAPDLWNVENPEAVEAVARGYVQAGSEVILTNTFGTNRYVLEKQGASDRVEELAETGVAISRRAAGDEARVFASIGPTGKIVMMREITRDDFLSAYVETARAISRAGPDAVVVETFNDLDELAIALEAVKGCCDLPVIACMSFTAGPDGTATMMGNLPEELAHMAEEHGADAVGANCGIGPETYVNVARRLRAATALPVWIKPNAGTPKVGPDGKTSFPIGPQEFAGYVSRFLEAGVNFIGGCCGTTPDHICAIRAALDATMKNRGWQPVEKLS